MEDWIEKNYEQRLALHRVLGAPTIDHEHLERVWKSYFTRTLYDCGWNKAAIDHIFFWGYGGHNWKVLWFVDDVSKEELVKTFTSDLSYFSDRMSFDRLFRLHHTYNDIQHTWQLEGYQFQANPFK